VANNTDNCPTLFGLIGNYCDTDADPNLVQLGVISNSCVCEPIGTDQTVFLDLRTPDGSSAQISWEIELVSATWSSLQRQRLPGQHNAPSCPPAACQQRVLPPAGVRQPG
jgi:hypothetical protein